MNQKPQKLNRVFITKTYSSPNKQNNLSIQEPLIIPKINICYTVKSNQIISINSKEGFMRKIVTNDCCFFTKLITASTALEENFTKPDIANDFYCNGFEQIYNIQIKCWSYPSTHQGESLREALMDSCNPSFMQLAKRIGASTLYKYYNAFGFFNKTNSGLPGEATSLFVSEEKCGPVELATMAFGQRFTITPLHMITAICAISNDGYLVKPQIVKSMTNTDTGEITEFNKTVVRRVLSSQTCNQMKSMMESVVKDGTGQNAKVDGYSIGGKSGTSEPIAGDKTSGYTTSFAAITPIDDPELVVLVTLYNPQGKSHMGGQTAAPVVANILSEVLPYLGIAPEN